MKLFLLIVSTVITGISSQAIAQTCKNIVHAESINKTYSDDKSSVEFQNEVDQKLPAAFQCNLFTTGCKKNGSIGVCTNKGVPTASYQYNDIMIEKRDSGFLYTAILKATCEYECVIPMSQSGK
jgi:hypothetical protein